MEKDEIDAVIREKKARLDGLIAFCEKRGYTGCASYLINARPDMFNAIENAGAAWAMSEPREAWRDA